MNPLDVIADTIRFGIKEKIFYREFSFLFNFLFSMKKSFPFLCKCFLVNDEEEITNLKNELKTIGVNHKHVVVE
jgi:hypothetical protein